MAGLIPSHQRPSRQAGNMVTGTTTVATASTTGTGTARESKGVDHQLSVSQPVDHLNLLESFSSGNKYTIQSTMLEPRTQDERNRATNSKQPLLKLPTADLIGIYQLIA